MIHAPARHGIRAAITTVLLTVLLTATLTGCAAATNAIRSRLDASKTTLSALPAPDTETTGASGADGTATTTAGTASAATSAVTLTGSVSGPITGTAVECSIVSPPYYAWQLTGTLNGQHVEADFHSNYYKGAATYKTTSITDAEGGRLGLTVGNANGGSSYATQGTFTVGSDGRSGSLDSTLTADGGQTFHITGPWACPGESSNAATDTASKNAITLSGSANGSITGTTVSCTTGGSYLQWSLKGSLNGSKVELAYTSNNYQGAGTYNATSITDARGGQLTWYVDGTGKAVSNGNDKGKFIISADQRSGTLDAQIAGDNNYNIHITGPWTCS